MDSKAITQENRAWLLLMVFRGISVLFAAISLSTGDGAMTLEPKILLVVGASALYTFFLVLGFRSIPQLLQRYPALMLADVFISFSFLYLTGANDSPFAFYAHAPVLTFSVLRGYKMGLITTVASMAAFIGSVWYKSGFTVISLTAHDTGTLAGFLPLFFLFSILGSLNKQSLEKNIKLEEAKNRLSFANEELESVNRQMIALQDINAVFQSFRDLPSTIDIVLDGIKYGLGYDRVVMGLFGTQRDMIASFHGVGPAGSNRQSDFSKTPLIGGEVIDPLFESNEPTRVDSQEDARSLPGNVVDYLKLKSYIVAPLTVADKRIGIVIADNQNSKTAIDDHNMTWLKLLSSHAAVAINNAHLHTKTQELAVLTERNRIAMEIHDGLSQTLSGARLILDSCQQMVGSRPEVVRSKLTYLDGILGRSYEEMRYAIYNLRLPYLSENSFSTFLSQIVQDFKILSDIKVSLTVAGSEEQHDLSENLKFCLCRVLQEGLNNVRKHSEATSLSVYFGFQKRGVILRIADDGCGFNAANARNQARGGSTFGMVALEDRVRRLGGELVIESSLGRGTSVLVSVPYLAKPEVNLDKSARR